MSPGIRGQNAPRILAKISQKIPAEKPAQKIPAEEKPSENARQISRRILVKAQQEFLNESQQDFQEWIHRGFQLKMSSENSGIPGETQREFIK